MKPEEFFAVLGERRSIRRFRPDPVGRDTWQRLFEAAAWAPSASNRQDWEFIAVTSRTVIASMAQAVRARWNSLTEKAGDSGLAPELAKYSANFDWFSGAPAVVAIACRTPEAFLNHILGPAAPVVAGGRASAAMAAQNLMLAAHVLGLGSCCLTGPLAAADELGPLLGLGRRHELVCLVALGYPAEEPARPDRKGLDAIGRFVE